MARLAAKNFRKPEDERTERESGRKETKFSARRCFRSKIEEREKRRAAPSHVIEQGGKERATEGHRDTYYGMGKETGKCTECTRTNTTH